MQLNLKNNVEIIPTENEKKRIKIKVKNTEYWVLGEQNKNRTWNIYMVNTPETYKRLLYENYLTRDFALFTGLILEQPFPYQGKSAKLIKLNIVEILTKIYGYKKNNISRKDSKLQNNCKKLTKNGINKSKTS